MTLLIPAIEMLRGWKESVVNWWKTLLHLL